MNVFLRKKPRSLLYITLLQFIAINLAVRFSISRILWKKDEYEKQIIIF